LWAILCVIIVIMVLLYFSSLAGFQIVRVTDKALLIHYSAEISLTIRLGLRILMFSSLHVHSPGRSLKQLCGFFFRDNIRCE